MIVLLITYFLTIIIFQIYEALYRSIVIVSSF